VTYNDIMFILNVVGLKVEVEQTHLLKCDGLYESKLS
jgi:hypothetical protein